ncbi:MAG: hypothetical protein R3F59_18305 [Myxococcota bacterium]
MLDRTPRRTTLDDDGFATHSLLGDLDPLALPEGRDEEAAPPGPWLDDPAYEVGHFLLGLPLSASRGR